MIFWKKGGRNDEFLENFRRGGGGGGISDPKICYKIAKRGRRGAQKPFGSFPKIHPKLDIL